MLDVKTDEETATDHPGRDNNGVPRMLDRDDLINDRCLGKERQARPSNDANEPSPPRRLNCLAQPAGLKCSPQSEPCGERGRGRDGGSRLEVAHPRPSSADALHAGEHREQSSGLLAMTSTPMRPIKRRRGTASVVEEDELMSEQELSPRSQHTAVSVDGLSASSLSTSNSFFYNVVDQTQDDRASRRETVGGEHIHSATSTEETSTAKRVEVRTDSRSLANVNGNGDAEEERATRGERGRHQLKRMSPTYAIAAEQSPHFSPHREVTRRGAMVDAMKRGSIEHALDHGKALTGGHASSTTVPAAQEYAVTLLSGAPQRKSCDRCFRMKTKCTRAAPGASSDDPCEGCIRRGFGHDCVTSRPDFPHPRITLAKRPRRENSGGGGGDGGEPFNNADEHRYSAGMRTLHRQTPQERGFEAPSLGRVLRSIDCDGRSSFATGGGALSYDHRAHRPTLGFLNGEEGQKHYGMAALGGRQLLSQSNGRSDQVQSMRSTSSSAGIASAHRYRTAAPSTSGFRSASRRGSIERLTDGSTRSAYGKQDRRPLTLPGESLIDKPEKEGTGEAQSGNNGIVMTSGEFALLMAEIKALRREVAALRG